MTLLDDLKWRGVLYDQTPDLDDHLAGSALGLSLARSASARETKGPMARFLRELVADLENDQTALRALMKDLDFTENRVKNALGWLGAQAIRYKPNGRLLGRSPLSRVLDLEALIAGSRARAQGLDKSSIELGRFLKFLFPKKQARQVAGKTRALRAGLHDLIHAFWVNYDTDIRMPRSGRFDLLRPHALQAHLLFQT